MLTDGEKPDWLALYRAIAELHVKVVPDSDWKWADDQNLTDEFDPYQALREIGTSFDEAARKNS